MELKILTPYDFGARGDGETDDTLALQNALNEAAEGSGTLFFPKGTYKTDVLTVPRNVCLKADATWDYRTPGRTVLVPLRAEQSCILDMTNAQGVTLEGLCLYGKGMGEKMHGVSLIRENEKNCEELSIRIDTCKVFGFTGNGLNMEGAWAFTVRHSYVCANRGFGLYLDGFDAFIHDNWFSANGIAGFGGVTWNSSVNFTSNRVEWNRKCGMLLQGGMHYNITANYFDRSYGPAIVMKEGPNFHKRMHLDHTVIPHSITVTGNNFLRSGKTAEPGSDDDCHIYMESASGVTVTANTFHVWKDDGPHGRVSPWYGIIYKNCAHCVIADNAMLPGAKKALFADRGGNGEQMLIHDNAGAVIPEDAQNSQDPFTPPHFMVEGNDPFYKRILHNECHYVPLEEE